MEPKQQVAQQVDLETGPGMRAHYSFKRGQQVQYAHLFFQEADTARLSVTDILAQAPGHLAFQTTEEVETYLREERDAWERQPRNTTSAA